MKPQMLDRKDSNTAPVKDTAGDAAPKRIAHYDLKREIGRGALSVVYDAQDTRTGQEAALKLKHRWPCPAP